MATTHRNNKRHGVDALQNKPRRDDLLENVALITDKLNQHFNSAFYPSGVVKSSLSGWD